MTVGTENCGGCKRQNRSMMPLGMDQYFTITPVPDHPGNRDGTCECLDRQNGNGENYKECDRREGNDCRNTMAWRIKFLKVQNWRLPPEHMPPMGEKVVVIVVNRCGERKTEEFVIQHYLANGLLDPTDFGKLRFTAECTACSGDCP